MIHSSSSCFCVLALDRGLRGRKGGRSCKHESGLGYTCINQNQQVSSSSKQCFIHCIRSNYLRRCLSSLGSPCRRLNFCRCCVSSAERGRFPFLWIRFEEKKLSRRGEKAPKSHLATAHTLRKTASAAAASAAAEAAAARREDRPLMM